MTASTKTTPAGGEPGSTRHTRQLSALRPAARLLLIAGLAALGSVSLAVPSRAAHAPKTPAVPSNLEVPAGHRLVSTAHAIGTQSYVCLPRATGTGLGWTHFGPQATLFDDELEQVQTHFLSVSPDDSTIRPTWQHSHDSSSAWAVAVASSSDLAFVAPGAIPWLLLRVEATQEGPSGGRRLWPTTYIQRVRTIEGAAPAGDCPAVGARIFVPYAADYVFYRARRSPDRSP
jgi:hypothetical protein